MVPHDPITRNQSAPHRYAKKGKAPDDSDADSQRQSLPGKSRSLKYLCFLAYMGNDFIKPDALYLFSEHHVGNEFVKAGFAISFF